MIDDVHLGEGGLLRRLEVRCHLTRLWWQILGVVTATWLPIVALAAFEAVFRGSSDPLARDPGVHVRLLVAAPLLLYLDLQFPRVCHRTIRQLVEQEFIPEPDQPRIERTLRTAARFADSPVPEIVLATVSIGLSVASLPGWAALTPVQLWYAIVAQPLFEFLLLRSLWRWAIWVCVLIGIERIDLELEPTHPDRCGGIAFLRLPAMEYCATLLFVLSSVVCTTWHSRLVLGTTIGSFVPLLLLFAAIGTLIAFGPLLLLVPQLVRARRAGIIELGGLAAKLGRRFRRRWIQGQEAAQDPAIEADINADAQTLAAIASSYHHSIHQLRILPLDLHDLVILVVATLIPVVPVMLARVPRADWMQIAKLVGGSILPI